MTERSISEAKNPGSLPDVDFKPSEGDEDSIGEAAIELRDHDLDVRIHLSLTFQLKLPLTVYLRNSFVQSDPNLELGDMPTEFPPEINTV